MQPILQPASMKQAEDSASTEVVQEISAVSGFVSGSTPVKDFLHRGFHMERKVDRGVSPCYNNGRKG